jgi:hypothetical protein
MTGTILGALAALLIAAPAVAQELDAPQGPLTPGTLAPTPETRAWVVDPSIPEQPQPPPPPRALAPQPRNERSQPGANPQSDPLASGVEVLAAAITNQWNGDRPTTDPGDFTVAASSQAILSAVNRRWSTRRRTDGGFINGGHFDATIDEPGFSKFDPWVVFDSGSNMFFMVFTGMNNDNQTGKFWMLTHKADGTPGGCVYTFTMPAGQWLDYPKVGVDKDGIYITGDVVFFSQPGVLQYSKIIAMRKSDYAKTAACTGAPVWEWVNIKNPNGSTAFTIHPVSTVGYTATSPGKEYLVNQYQGTGFVLWRLRWANGLPSLDPAQSLDTPDFARPNDAPQLGTLVLIETNDARVRSGFWRSDRVYLAHHVAATGGYTEIRVYEIHPQGASTTITNVLTQTGNNTYYIYPGITQDANGKLYLTYTRTHSTIYLQPRFKRRVAGTWEASQTLQNSNSYDTSGRWGDYAGAAPDPNGTMVWLFNGYVSSTDIVDSWVVGVQ